jgi:hypothetical protein
VSSAYAHQAAFASAGAAAGFRTTAAVLSCVALVLFIAGTIVLILFDDDEEDPYQKWFKTCEWGQDRDAGKDIDAQLADLLELILRPSLKVDLRVDGGSVQFDLTLNLPIFIRGRTKAKVELSVREVGGDSYHWLADPTVVLPASSEQVKPSANGQGVEISTSIKRNPPEWAQGRGKFGPATQRALTTHQQESIYTGKHNLHVWGARLKYDYFGSEEWENCAEYEYYGRLWRIFRLS